MIRRSVGLALTQADLSDLMQVGAPYGVPEHEKGVRSLFVKLGC